MHGVLRHGGCVKATGIFNTRFYAKCGVWKSPQTRFIRKLKYGGLIQNSTSFWFNSTSLKFRVDWCKACVVHFMQRAHYPGKLGCTYFCPESVYISFCWLHTKVQTAINNTWHSRFQHYKSDMQLKKDFKNKIILFVYGCIIYCKLHISVRLLKHDVYKLFVGGKNITFLEIS